MDCYCGCATKASKIRHLLAFGSLIVGPVLMVASVALLLEAMNDYDGANVLLLCSSAVI